MNVQLKAQPNNSSNKRLKTQVTEDNLYDDSNEEHNELIAMELESVNNTVAPQCRDPMVQLQWQCTNFKLPPPLSTEVIESANWDYVFRCDEKALAPGYEFHTAKELQDIPRRHSKFPFCHPGPLRDEQHQLGDWYYADSIVQKLEFNGLSEKFYSVRWIGYEDRYNTVECEENLHGTAILFLFDPTKKIYTASRDNGAPLLRRSARQMNKIQSTIGTTLMMNDQSPCSKVIEKLKEYLKVEENLHRYYSQIGFYS